MATMSIQLRYTLELTNHEYNLVTKGLRRTLEDDTEIKAAESLVGKLCESRISQTKTMLENNARLEVNIALKKSLDVGGKVSEQWP